VIATPTTLPGVLVLESPVYRDDRGFFTEVFHEVRFAELGLPRHFAQDNHSRSSRNVLRGIHFQRENPQGKLVRPVSGAIFDVAVDLRRSSPHFAQWVGVTLTAGDGRQLWIPAGFGHGFLVLSDCADISYKCTTVYHPESNSAIRWDDRDIGINWPLAEGTLPLLSPSDAAASPLANAHCYP
jgi:dTDP-4-dehydrorhamnose 3,5-epimerase